MAGFACSFSNMLPTDIISVTRPWCHLGSGIVLFNSHSLSNLFKINLSLLIIWMYWFSFAVYKEWLLGSCSTFTEIVIHSLSLLLFLSLSLSLLLCVCVHFLPFPLVTSSPLISQFLSLFSEEKKKGKKLNSLTKDFLSQREITVSLSEWHSGCGASLGKHPLLWSTQAPANRTQLVTSCFLHSAQPPTPSPEKVKLKHQAHKMLQ